MLIRHPSPRCWTPAQMPCAPSLEAAQIAPGASWWQRGIIASTRRACSSSRVTLWSGLHSNLPRHCTLFQAEPERGLWALRRERQPTQAHARPDRSAAQGSLERAWICARALCWRRSPAAYGHCRWRASCNRFTVARPRRAADQGLGIAVMAPAFG